MSSEVRVFVDQAGFDHQKEAVRRCCDSTSSAALHLLGQIGLVRKLLDGAALEELAVERAVHVAEREQAEQLRGRWIVGERRHLGAGRRHGIAGVAELADEVGFVLALARLAPTSAGSSPRPPPMMHVGLRGEELLDDLVVVGAPAGMRHHGGGRGVLDLGVGDDADRHAEPCA